LEDAIKAAYVYKFAPFVTWPSTLPPGGAFTICSVGSDRVAALLPQVTEGQRIDGRPIRVLALEEASLPGECQIVYVAASANAAAILDALHGKPVLTVTSGDGRHGVVHLVTIERHVDFDIDDKLASEDGLSISSKLLGLAHSVIRTTETQP
jgi:hypothetical protein